MEIPEEYERGEQILELKEKISEGNLALAGEFMEELKTLTETAKDAFKSSEKEYKEAAGARDRARGRADRGGKSGKAVSEPG